MAIASIYFLFLCRSWHWIEQMIEHWIICWLIVKWSVSFLIWIDRVAFAFLLSRYSKWTIEMKSMALLVYAFGIYFALIENVQFKAFHFFCAQAGEWANERAAEEQYWQRTLMWPQPKDSACMSSSHSIVWSAHSLSESICWANVIMQFVLSFARTHSASQASLCLSYWRIIFHRFRS